MILWKNSVCNAKGPSLCEQLGRPSSYGLTKPGCTLGTSTFRLALQGPPAGSRVSPGCMCDLGVSPVRSGSLPLSSGNIFYLCQVYILPHIMSTFALFKNVSNYLPLGIPWQSNGWDSTVLQEAWVQSLVRELRSCKLHNSPPQKKLPFIKVDS